MDERDLLSRLLQRREDGRLSNAQRRQLRDLLGDSEIAQRRPELQEEAPARGRSNRNGNLLSDGNPPFLEDPLAVQRLRQEPRMRIRKHNITQCFGGGGGCGGCGGCGGDGDDDSEGERRIVPPSFVPLPATVTAQGAVVFDNPYGVLSATVQLLNATVSPPALLYMDRDAFQYDCTLKAGVQELRFARPVPQHMPLLVAILPR